MHEMHAQIRSILFIRDGNVESKAGFVINLKILLETATLIFCTVKQTLKLWQILLVPDANDQGFQDRFI